MTRELGGESAIALSAFGGHPGRQVRSSLCCFHPLLRNDATLVTSHRAHATPSRPDCVTTRTRNPGRVLSGVRKRVSRRRRRRCRRSKCREFPTFRGTGSRRTRLSRVTARIQSRVTLRSIYRAIGAKLSPLVHSRQNSKPSPRDRRRSTPSPISLARTILRSSAECPSPWVRAHGHSLQSRIAQRGGGRGGDNDDNRGDGWCEGGERIAHSRWRVSDYRVSTRERQRGGSARQLCATTIVREGDYVPRPLFRHTELRAKRKHSRDEGTTDRETSRCVRRRSPARECEDCARLRETAREGRRPLPPQRSTDTAERGRGRPSAAPRCAAPRGR